MGVEVCMGPCPTEPAPCHASTLFVEREAIFAHPHVDGVIADARDLKCGHRVVECVACPGGEVENGAIRSALATAARVSPT